MLPTVKCCVITTYIVYTLTKTYHFVISCKGYKVSYAKQHKSFCWHNVSELNISTNVRHVSQYTFPIRCVSVKLDDGGTYKPAESVLIYVQLPAVFTSKH